MSIKKIEDKANFLNVLTKLFVDKSLSKLDVFLYSTISYYLNLNEFCARTCRELAEEVSASKSAVAESTNRLVEKGYLAKVLKDGTTSQYLLVLPNSQMVITHKKPKKLSTKSPKKRKSCPAERTPCPAERTELSGQADKTGDHTLYIKEIKRKLMKESAKKSESVPIDISPLAFLGFSEDEETQLNNFKHNGVRVGHETINNSIKYYAYRIKQGEVADDHKSKFFYIMRTEGYIEEPKDYDKFKMTQERNSDNFIIPKTNELLAKMKLNF